MTMYSHEPGSDAPAGTTPDDVRPPGEAPLSVSHAYMNTARAGGEVALLGPDVPWIVRHQDFWWVAGERAWLRVTDDLVAAELDDAAARFKAAEASGGLDGRAGHGVRGGQGQDLTAEADS